VKIGVAYEYEGRTLSSVPSSLEILSKVKVVYETLPGWQEDLSKCKSWEDMPQAARQYVIRIEQLVGVPVVWIGVGAGRDALIERSPQQQ
jgi:adenylosuccinate synthase